MGSHSVTCYPTQVNVPRLNPSQPGRYFATWHTALTYYDVSQQFCLKIMIDGLCFQIQGVIGNTVTTFIFLFVRFGLTFESSLSDVIWKMQLCYREFFVVAMVLC